MIRKTVRVRRPPLRAAATIAVALALVTATGCSGDEPKKPDPGKRSSAKADCAGIECKVRVVCKGKVRLRYGPAPVQIRTQKTALVTTFFVDFAGSKNDATLRC